MHFLTVAVAFLRMRNFSTNLLPSAQSSVSSSNSEFVRDWRASAARLLPSSLRMALVASALAAVAAD